MLKLSEIIFESLEDREKNIQRWLDDLVDRAPGKDRGEKLQYLWDKDPRWGKVVKALRNFNRYQPPHPETYKAKFQADHYYIRFGDLPKSGKSANHVTGGFEKGISAYPVKWNVKRNMWELDTSQLSDIGLNTLDSLISDFYDKKGRPIYLIQGQSLNDLGIHDDEPLLDVNKIKVIKKLKPEEIWIDHFGGNDWGNVDEVMSLLPEIKKFDIKRSSFVADPRPMSKVKEFVESLLKDLKPLQYELGFSKVRIHYVVQDRTALARYAGVIDKTFEPIITISTRILQQWAQKYGRGLATEVEVVLVHEFGHAYLEIHTGMSARQQVKHKGPVENAVIKFSEKFAESRNIEQSKKILDDFIEDFSFEDGSIV